MKGQINIEFLSAAMIYLITLVGIITIGSGVLPNFANDLDQASLNLEANQISTSILTTPGYSTAGSGTEDWHSNSNTLDQVSSFGIANSSDQPFVVERDKINSISGFQFTETGPKQYFNYSQFKSITGAENQYKLNFTWLPVVETYRSYHRGELGNARGGISRYMFEEENGPVEDRWDNYNGQANGGVDRDAEGIQGTNAFRFDGSNDHVMTNNQIEIPQRYSMFTWVNGQQSNQNDWAYIGGFNDEVGLLIRGNSPLTGIVIRDSGGSNYVTYATSENVLDGTWHHVGATVNRDTGEVNVYVDGERVHQESLSSHISGDERMILGSLENNDHHFEGRLDEFRYYNRELADDEVKDLYNTQVTLPVVPPETDSYNNSDNIVHYGNETLNGQDYKFLVTSHNDRYDTLYVSEDWNFNDDTEGPLSLYESFTMNGNSFTVNQIQNQGHDPGSAVVLKQHVNEFGPERDSDSVVVRLDRYAVMEGEPLRMEVLAW